VLSKKKKECRKDGSARNTIGARYLPKNTVVALIFFVVLFLYCIYVLYLVAFLLPV
jgi:hypothetical protein